MFKKLNKYKAIIVTGIQRSGTRVCAKMIAHDTGYKYIDEKNFGYDIERFFDYCAKDNVVVQAPNMCKFVHLLSCKENLVIFMLRSYKDILKSQKKLHNFLLSKPNELAQYSEEYENCKVDLNFIKMDYWFRFQRDNIENSMEVNYEDLVIFAQNWLGCMSLDCP